MKLKVSVFCTILVVFISLSMIGISSFAEMSIAPDEFSPRVTFDADHEEYGLESFEENKDNVISPVQSDEFMKPAVPKLNLIGNNASKEYDGKPLTMMGESGYTLVGSLGDFKLIVEYNDITESGTVDTIASYEIQDKNGRVLFTKAELDDSTNFTVNNGLLTVIPRALKLIAISGELNTKGENITAASLSTLDGSFTNGYRQFGLLSGHQLSGNFVQGSGKESFKTSIDPEAVRITSGGVDVTDCYDIQTQDGFITINAPMAYDLIVNPRSYTWTYDGIAHSMREYDYSGLVHGDKLVRVSFSNEATITNVGTQSNRITSVEMTTANGGDVDVNKYVLISTPGTLTVEQRDLTVTAISGSLTTNGTEVVAASLTTPDGSFVNGFKAEGLVPGHVLTGNFVTGSGTTTFNTYIDLNNLRVVDANGADVTSNYRIKTLNGTIIINSVIATQQESQIPLTVTAKSGTFTYDGTEHRLNEYSVVGLVDGDVIERVVFKPSSVITDVGTVVNEIMSVEIRSATGTFVDANKYGFNCYAGTLTVTKFPLILTAVSDEKIYDGKPLNNETVKSSALATSNHTLSADYLVFDSNGNYIASDPVNLGIYTKEVSNVKITSGNTDVTANYDIKMVDGTLKITGSSGESSRATTTNAYYGNTFTIRSDAPYSEFKYLLIDGQKIPTDNYTVKQGSTIITLKSSYILSLKAGEHNYTVVSASKQVDGNFYVMKEHMPLTSGDFTYVVLKDGTAEIIAYTGNADFLVIPGVLDDVYVTSIGDGAFALCSSLITVTIPDSVTSIGRNPFVGCEKLVSVVVSPDNPAIASIDGVLFSKVDKRLVCYPMGIIAQSYSIPIGIIIIGDEAFAYCESLTSVIIPDSVTSIGDMAFVWCESLTSVIIHDSVVSIGDNAFFGSNVQLMFTVGRNSYAAAYCKENNLSYIYPDSNDWLNG